MLGGFPILPLASESKPIDTEHEIENPNGCVNMPVLPPVESVRLSYVALCHLAQLAQGMTVKRSVHGSACGVQLGETVEITQVLPTIHVEPLRGRDDKEEVERHDEKERDARMQCETMSKIYRNEELDTYRVGSFAICSVAPRLRIFGDSSITQLMKLHSSNQPAVLLTFDPFRTALFGRPYVRAYTLTETCIAYYKGLEAKKLKTDAQRRPVLMESQVTAKGTFREIPVSLDVGAYQTLGLACVPPQELDNDFTAIHAGPIDDYVEMLVSSILDNTTSVCTSLERERKFTDKEHSSAPLAQNIDTLANIANLCEQAEHLEALCDSMLLNSSIIRDL